MRTLIFIASVLFATRLPAAESGDPICNAIMQDVFTKLSTEEQKYLHGALKYFFRELFHLNKIAPAHPKTVLCHFTRGMGLNPQKGVSETITKTFGEKSVVLTVTSPPTESFATSEGYDFKGEVKFGTSGSEATFMVLYWSGQGDTEDETKDNSFGFLIHGPGGVGQDGQTQKRMGYFQWSRKQGSDQFVRALEAQYTTSYLTSAAAPDGGKFGGDRATYGEVTFNKSTKSATIQVVKIENQRQGGTSGQFGCFKMFGTGTKDGTIKVAKTQDSLSGTGHAVNFTALDSSQMDGVELTDSVSTPNGSGTQLSGTGLSFVAFDRSCNYLNTADDAGGPFLGDTVSFTASPTDIFP